MHHRCVGSRNSKKIKYLPITVSDPHDSAGAKSHGVPGCERYRSSFWRQLMMQRKATEDFFWESE